MAMWKAHVKHCPAAYLGIPSFLEICFGSICAICMLSPKSCLPHKLPVIRTGGPFLQHFATFCNILQLREALLEEDGVYLEVCQAELEEPCPERARHMIRLFTECILVTVGSSALLALVVDRMGPAFLSLLGGICQAGGLFLLATSSTDSTDSTATPGTRSPLDGFVIAFGLIGVGGAALQVQAMKLPFVIPRSRFALVMTLLNCLVDSSSVTPLGLYRLYLAGRPWPPRSLHVTGSYH